MAIPLASNFNVNVALPIDSRMVVENDSALNNISNKYLGLVAFSNQSRTLFYLKDVDTWVPFGTGIGGGGEQGNIFYADSGVYFSGLRVTFDKTTEVIFEGNAYLNKINNQTSFGVYNYYIDENSNLPINLQLSGLPLGIRTGNLVNLFYKDLNNDGALVYQPTIMELYTGGSEEDLFPIINHPYYEGYDGKIPMLRKIKNVAELDLQYKEIYNTYTFTGQKSFENLDLRNEFLIKNSVYNLNFEVGKNNSNYSIYLPDAKSGIDYSSRNFFNIDAIENVDDLNFQDFQQKLRSVNLSFYGYEYTGNGNYGNTLNLIYEKNSIDYDDKIEFIFEEFGWKLRNSYLANSVKQHSHQITEINDLPQYLDRIDFTKEIEKKYTYTESESPFLFEIFEPMVSGLYFGNKVSSNSDGSVILIAETGRNRVSIYTGSQAFGWNFKQTLGPSIASIANGLSVSLNSDASIIFVGANVNSSITPLRGRILIYTGSADDGWSGSQGLLDLADSNPSYLSSSLGFSSACNYDGSILFVGMPTNSISGITGGAVNIYTGSQDRSYVRVQTISGENLQNNRFGENLSTNFWGDTVLISSLGDNNTGLISIYTGDNKNWGLKQTLTGGRLSSNNYDSSVLYIGYPNFGNITNDAGKVSIYTGNRFDGWALTQSITGGSGDKFGSSLANNADGSILFIGGIGNTTGLVNGFTSTGAVWAYTGYNLDQWGLAYRVKESGTKAFGNSIATDYDGTLLLSADQLGDLTSLGYNASGTGVVYSYINLPLVSTIAQSLDFKVPITINGQPLSGGVGSNVVYTTGNQIISGVKSFSNETVFKDNLLYLSQASGQISGIEYTGYYDGGQFLGRVKLSQNNTRLINVGNTWTAKESSRIWYKLAMSSDGKYQSATVYGGQIYISSDYGNTWTAKDSNRSWQGIAMSSDGKYQSATVFNGQVYISKDYGNIWVARDSNRAWESITMSSDGKYQTAVGINTQIYISNDYGDTWVPKESNRSWSGVTMSSDGKYQSATVNNGQIYISSDYGNTWTAKDSNRNWVGVAMSSDGKYQSATVYEGQVYISKDYGNIWVARDSNRNWYSIAMSFDGKYQTADVYGGQVYISSNYGNTWTAKDSNRNWHGIAMSSDGKYQSNVTYGGQIYVSVADEIIDGSFTADNIYGNNLVYTTGNQTISGVKTFASRPTVNGTGALLSGEAVAPLVDINNITNNFTFNSTHNGKVLYVSGNTDITGSLPPLGFGLNAFLEGYNVSVVQFGSGNVIFNNGGVNGAYFRNRLNLNKTAGKYAIASILRLDQDEFLLYGDLV